MPVRDASSSPSVSRIVDDIPTSESGVAQNFRPEHRVQRHRSTRCCEDDGGIALPADAGACSGIELQSASGMRSGK